MPFIIETRGDLNKIRPCYCPDPEDDGANICKKCHGEILLPVSIIEDKKDFNRRSTARRKKRAGGQKKT
jgi:hypothetical protein